MNDPFKDPSPPEMFTPIFRSVITDEQVERAARVLAVSWSPDNNPTTEWMRALARQILVAALRS